MFIYRNHRQINNKNFAFCKLEGKLSTCVNAKSKLLRHIHASYAIGSYRT